MFDKSHFTAQEALDMISAGEAPLDFGSGLPVYRAAVRRIAQTSVPGLINSDLTAVPMSLAFIEFLCERLDRTSPACGKERKRRKDWMSRLRTIARRLEDVPVVLTSPAWADCLTTVSGLTTAHDLTKQDMIPLSTLRQSAVEDGLDPADLTAEWLTTLVQRAGAKRRDSLRRAAKLFDKLREDLPSHLRPPRAFGPITILSRKRRSHKLPPRVADELEKYLALRVRGTVLPGLLGEVKVQDGIKSDQSTNVYRQAMGWMFDSLCFADLVSPGDDLQISDLARFDWLAKVAVEALSDYRADEGKVVLPWQPITPVTIYNRTACLIHLFSSLDTGFKAESVTVTDPQTDRPVSVKPEELKSILSAHVSPEITEAHQEFCRKIVAAEAKQRLLLNMHTICWDEANRRWQDYEKQGRHEQMQTMNLCVLAAILALVVHIPFRARTVTEMLVGGDRPDLSLPKQGKRIEFHIAPLRMKIPKRFDAVLEDSGSSRPRQIIDWFMAGPRQELLRNPLLLRDPKPDRLFCGIGTARYNRILVGWTEEIGMRMTTHLFRHALASVLINCCEVSLEEVAGLLGNTVATVERNYVFHDRIRQRGRTIQKLEDYRLHLVDTQHPGRRRKA